MNISPVFSVLFLAFGTKHLATGVVNDYAQLAETVDRLEAQLQAQQQELAQLRAAVEKKVAFTVACAEGDKFYATSTDSIIPFDTLVTNVGNAYSTASHTFRAPYNGVYFFIINADVSPDYEILSVRKNGELIFWADKDDIVTTHVSGSAVATLRAGDVISANHVNRDRGFVECGRDTTFSGFLIHY